MGFQFPVATAKDQNATESAVGSDPVPVTLRVNDRTYTLRLEPRVTLASALRDHLDLSGTKLICDRGACGGCTVLLDGEPVVSCMVLAVTAQGKAIYRKCSTLWQDCDCGVTKLLDDSNNCLSTRLTENRISGHREDWP